MSHSGNFSDLTGNKERLLQKFAASSYLEKFPWIISTGNLWTFDLFAIRLLDPKLLKLEWLKGTYAAKPELKLERCEQDPEVRTCCYVCGAKFMIKKDELKQYASCFISYSHIYESFAKYLYSRLSLHTNCWFAPEDMKFGEKIRDTIEASIKNNDYLLLVLSENSINSNWVEKEVETSFEKESKTNKTVLLPVRIDDTILNTDKAWAPDIRRTRNIGDFKGWENDDMFEKAFNKLLFALENPGKSSAN